MYSVLFKSRNKPQPLNLPSVLYSGRNEVNTGSLNTGMPQHICQLGHIPAGAVERAGKQVPQVVGENLGRCYACFLT